MSVAGSATVNEKEARTAGTSPIAPPPISSTRLRRLRVVAVHERLHQHPIDLASLREELDRLGRA